MSQAPVIFSLFGYDDLAKSIAEKLNYEIGALKHHQFPDGETMIRIDSPISKREVIFVASLDRPNAKLLPLLFAAETAKQLAATKVTLIAPYLAYMRQDKAFHPGEGITSRYYAKLLSSYFDELITIDPHLHRFHSLNEIYSLKATVLHASSNIAHWICDHVANPILIGPDMESKQWVEEIALKAKSPYLILEKTRKSDTLVDISLPNIVSYQDATPILIDDIISTAMTMIETVNQLKTLRMNPPICIGVHAVFAGNAYQDLVKSGVEQVITCNTIQHISNGIDISNQFIEQLRLTR